MLVITADVHERASRVPRLLEELGAQVDVLPLARGDYVVGPETIVERKTVHDLHLSIMRGRFWHQIGKIRAAGEWPCLVIEGTSLFAGPLRNEAVRGACLAVGDLGITIIRTQDAHDTAAWLYRLAVRRSAGGVRDRPAYARRPRSPTTSPAEAAIASAPDISVVTARRVLAKFGSLRGVCEASAEDLMSIPGVGVKRATSILDLFDEPWHATRSN